MPTMPALGAPFRIIKGPATPLPSSPDQYLARLVKLVPSEVVALYLAFKEVAATWLGIWATICLVLVVFVRAFGTNQQGKGIQWGAVVVAAVSYILWVYATGGYILQFHLPESAPGIISVAIGVWTFLIPYFYQGD